MTVLTQNTTWEIELSKIVAQTWVDAKFRQQLINDPAATLKKAGLEFGDSVEVRVIENQTSDGGFTGVTEGKMIFELPLPPKPSDLTDEQINNWFEAGSICGNNNVVIRVSST